MKRKPPLVEVTWYDACSYREDMDLRKARKKCRLMVRRTVGYLVRRTKRVVVVAQTFDPEDKMVASTWAIPAPWVIRRRKVRKQGCRCSR